jgi:hypothetical protein
VWYLTHSELKFDLATAMPTLKDKILRVLKKNVKGLSDQSQPEDLNQSNLPAQLNQSEPEDLSQSNQPYTKTQLLHAFRTITLMLSLIHSTKRITNTSTESNPDLRKELKPLDALAAIAIRQHGIAATIAMRNETSGTLEVLTSSDLSSSNLPRPTSGTLEVLTSSDSPSSHLPRPTLPQPSSSASKLAKLYTFLLTLNPRNDGKPRSTTKGRKEPDLLNDKDPQSSTTAKIVDPDTEIPESLKDCKESDLLKTYLTDVW